MREIRVGKRKPGTNQKNSPKTKNKKELRKERDETSFLERDFRETLKNISQKNGRKEGKSTLWK